MMKAIIYFSFFFFVFFSNAQISPILDHTWELQQIDTGTQIIPADPNPLGEDEPYQLTFSHVSNNIDLYYNLYAQCEYYLSFDDNNTKLYHNSLGCTLGTGETSQIAQYFNQTFIQQNSNVASLGLNQAITSYGPLSYNFTTAGDFIYLHITNSIGEVATFYANNLSQEEFLKTSISMYPNPVKDILFFKSAGIAIEKVKVYDLNGRLVEVFSLENEYQIDVSNLPQGVYIIEIETAIGVMRDMLVKR